MTIETRGLIPKPGATRAPLDIARIRADFPILATQVHGHPLVYLDNGASAQKPRQVLDAMDRAYRSQYANVHRGLHYLSNAATSAFEDAREVTRGFLNAPAIEEIIFTRNATSAINLVASSFGANFGPGDEIVLSIMEHHSNIVPWHFLRERQGAVLQWAPITADGTFLIDEFEKLLGPRTRLVAITQMSNVLGSIVPIREVVRIAHARGIPVLVDGSQAAVHMSVDVQAMGCDFYVFTGHKVYGPTGIGVLWGKRERLEAMRPFEGGGEMIEVVARDRVTYGRPPHRFEAGTPAIVEAIGLGAALTYMKGVGMETIARHEAELRDYAHARLGELSWVRIFGTAKDKGSIVSFTVDGLHPHDVATVVDRSGVAIRAGHHCAQPLMERLGVMATCRASFAMYNTRDEIDALVTALRRARKLFA